MRCKTARASMQVKVCGTIAVESFKEHAARAVQVVELEVPVGGARGERGTTRGRCRVAAATAAVGKRKSLEEEPWAAPAVARSPIVRNLPALRVESM